MSEPDWTRRDVVAVSLFAGGAAVISDLPSGAAEVTPDSVGGRKFDVVLVINGHKHCLAELDAHTTLLNALRDRLSLKAQRRAAGLDNAGRAQSSSTDDELTLA